MNQDHSALEVSRTLGINENALRRWVKQLRDERQGTTPQGKALKPEQQRIKELEAQVTEKSHFKKATALLMSD